MKKAIFKLHFDCGRMGELNGIFISTKEEVEKLVKDKTDIYFGEVLGKHSDIGGPLEECDYSFVTDDEEVVKIFEDNDLTTGYNPFDYINE